MMKLPRALAPLRSLLISLMSSSGMVEIPRLEAKLSFRNGRLILERSRLWACERQGVRIVIPVKTGIQKTEEDTGFLLPQE